MFPIPPIAERISKIRTSLPEDVSMVAVSKYHPVEDMLVAYNAGQRVFGESRQQELLAKIEQMPYDTVWHFIGHLQTNKVKGLIGHVDMIESIDSEHLLEVVERESVKAAVTTPVLMQVHVAKEETKYGFSPDELVDFFASGRYKKYHCVAFCGVMGMASNTDDTDRVRADFRAIADTYHRCLDAAPDLNQFTEISMGMSGDYPIAIECGATIVRIGSGIFGERQY